MPGRIRYDNLEAAVANVSGFHRQRTETERWTAFGSAHGIDAFHCRPMKARMRKAARKAISAAPVPDSHLC